MIEPKVFFAPNRRAKLAFAKFGASFRVGLSTLPQFELCVCLVMLILARL
jgi:hypothetical protein